MRTHPSSPGGKASRFFTSSRTWTSFQFTLETCKLIFNISLMKYLSIIDGKPELWTNAVRGPENLLQYLLEALPGRQPWPADSPSWAWMMGDTKNRVGNTNQGWKKENTDQIEDIFSFDYSWLKVSPFLLEKFSEVKKGSILNIFDKLFHGLYKIKNKWSLLLTIDIQVR